MDCHLLLLIFGIYTSTALASSNHLGGVTQLIYSSQNNLFLLNVTHSATASSSSTGSSSSSSTGGFSLTAGRPILLHTGLHDATALDILYENGLIYWTDASRERIRMISLSESKSRISSRVSRAPSALQNLARLGNQTSRGQRNHRGPPTPTGLKNVFRLENGTRAPGGPLDGFGGGKPPPEGSKMIPLSGTPRDVVKIGLLSPEGLAVDWMTRKIYWVDSERRRIEVAELDGSHRRVLYHRDLDQPGAIVLDHRHGYMYWTDGGERARIERAGMNGDSNTRSILIHDDIQWPSTIAIDAAEGRIYWSDSKLGYIDSVTMDGKDRRRILQDSHFLPSSLAVVEGWVFWTDWHRRAIVACGKEGGGESGTLVTILEQLQSPTGLHVYEPASRQIDVESGCSNNNGGCSHLCLLSPLPPFYQCSCPTGLPLLQDNRTCATSPGDMLVLVRRSDIRIMSLVGEDQFIDMVLDLPDIQHAVMVDHDPVSGKIYWTDDQSRTISRANINGSDIETVVSRDLGSPDGVAVDWVSGNLYWSDSATNLIEVSRLDGSSRVVVIREGLDEPRAIVLDPLNGRMYWTDWGTNAYIGGANLDGSGRVKIVDSAIFWPNGLTMDRGAGLLYWADAKFDQIEVVNVDGTGRRVIVMEEIPHVFGLALHGDHIYWTDWQLRRVERVRRGGGGEMVREREIIIEHLSDLMGITAISSSHNHGENECSKGNGGCSHLCLYRGPLLGSICACPFPLQISPQNNKTCTNPEAILIYSQRDSIRQISLADNGSDFTLPLQGLESVTSIDFHFAEDLIYWADRKTKTISRAHMNGTGQQVVVSVSGGTVTLAVDWLASNLYWTEGGNDQIVMSRMDGSSQRVIVWEGVRPRDILVDPIRGYLVWINALPGETLIERSALDGSSRKTLVTLAEGQVTSLAIDSASRTIYWTFAPGEKGQGRIESCDLDGKQRRLVVDRAGENPVGVALYEGRVYWLDRATKAVQSASIGPVNQDVRGVVRTEVGVVTDLILYHAVKQSGWNLCSTHSGSCSNLCIAGVSDISDRADAAATPELTRKCECPTHYELSPDDRTSCKEPSWYLLISKKTDISQLSLGSNIGGEQQGGRKTPVTPGPDTVLPLSASINSVIRAMDYSPVDDLIFWIDRARHMWSSSRNGSEIRQLIGDQDEGVLAGGVMSPYDLKVNTAEKVIYWSDSAQNIISVMRFDGSSVGAIIKDPQQKPRDIALAISRGLIFWSNVGRTPSIERAEMDGTSRQTLFNINIGRPGSVAVDGDRLFWSDLELLRIETSDIHGYNRRALVSSVSESISLITRHGWLLWVDREPKAVMGLQYDQPRVVPVTLRRMTSTVLCLAVVAQPEKGCSIGCSHLCVLSSDGSKRCSCPHGLQLSEKDGKTCETVTSCGKKSFQCGMGVGGVSVRTAKRGGRRLVNHEPMCISLQWRCDGQVDCPDESDEKNCSTICRSASGFSHFRCRNGKCASLTERCDGVPNCDDGSDEDGCNLCTNGLPRNASFEKCSLGRCFAVDQKCDGKVNCANGFDESMCQPTSFETDVTRFRSEGRVSSMVVILGIVGGSFFLLCPIIVAFLCCKNRLNHHCGIILCSPAKQKKGFCKTTNLESSSSSSSQPGSTTSSLQVSLLPASSSSIITSASLPLEHLALSQDSYCTADESQLYPMYPHEPLNPPPTPVVSDRSPIRSPSSCSDITSLYSNYRFGNMGAKHYPTPCSTEVGYGDESLAPSVVQISSDYGGYETEPLNPPPPPTPYDLSSDDRSSMAGSNVPNSSEKALVYSQRSRFPRRGRRTRQQRRGQRQDSYRQ